MGVDILFFFFFGGECPGEKTKNGKQSTWMVEFGVTTPFLRAPEVPFGGSETESLKMSSGPNWFGLVWDLKPWFL